MLEVNLVSEPAAYNPRACDCEFCREHDAAYISDPKGSVVVRVQHMSELKLAQQGDGLAEFLFCEDCDHLLGVRWHGFGSVNARALFDRGSFGEETSASPKKLSPDEKVSRWRMLWFPDFTVTTSNA